MNYRLEQFDKHGVKDKLDKQVEFRRDLAFCDLVDQAATAWRAALDRVTAEAEESLGALVPPESKSNAEFFGRYATALAAMKRTMADARAVSASIVQSGGDLTKLREELDGVADSLKEEFAETSRDLVVILRRSGTPYLNNLIS